MSGLGNERVRAGRGAVRYRDSVVFAIRQESEGRDPATGLVTRWFRLNRLCFSQE
jgi:hypothetical protein